MSEGARAGFQALKKLSNGLSARYNNKMSADDLEKKFTVRSQPDS